MMTTSNGGVKNVETAAAAVGAAPTNFDLYAGDFPCDEDISFENLLQLDNDIDKPQSAATATLQQAAPSQQCRPAVNPVQLAVHTTAAVGHIAAGAGGSLVAAPDGAVVYLLAQGSLRHPAAIGSSSVYDAATRNDVRPLLRFQIAKRPPPPTTTTSDTPGAELVKQAAEAQAASGRAAGGIKLSVQSGTSGDLAPISSIGDRFAVSVCPVAGLPPPSDAHGRLTLTTAAVNGDLSASQRVAMAAVARTTKSHGVLGGGGTIVASAGSANTGGSKSRSAAAADARQTVQEVVDARQTIQALANACQVQEIGDARQTVQEKNAYEYERVMDILRYYRELVVERKLPGACLPCKRRKSKPLVSADPVTPVSTRSAPLIPPPPSSVAARAASTAAAASVKIAIATSQCVRPVLLRSPTSLAITAASAATVAALTNASNTTISLTRTGGKRPTVAITGAYKSTAVTDRVVDAALSSEQKQSTCRDVEEPRRPWSVDLGDVLEREAADSQRTQLTRTDSLPDLCEASPEDVQSSAALRGPPAVEATRPHRPYAVGCRRHRRVRRAGELRRFVDDLQALGRSGADERDGGITNLPRKRPLTAESTPVNDETDVKQGDETRAEMNGNVDGGKLAEIAAFPVKNTSTPTTDSIVTKWTKSQLAISGPYPSWT